MKVGRVWAIGVGVALLLAAIGGCGAANSASSGPAGATAKTNVNVVLFLIDTLRADRLGAYGHNKPTSPAIDALAGEGVLFELASAPAPWTLPSVPSIHTSTFLCEHGVTIDGQKVSQSLTTLAERFKKLGYSTASHYVNDFAGPLTGLERGFDICRKHPAFVDGRTVSLFLEQKPALPFFMYIHNLEPHNPFNAPDEFIPLMGQVKPQAKQRLGKLLSAYRPLLRADFDPDPAKRRAVGTTDTTQQQNAILERLHKVLDEHLVLYDAVVREADTRVASVIQALKHGGVWDNTLFILLSDHGEELAEHGAYLHSQSVYQELAHVPLIIRFPKNEHAGKRVATPVNLVDVLPTIFDYLGRRDVIGAARGESLMPLVRGEAIADKGFHVMTARINVKKHYRPWKEQRGDRNVAFCTPDGRYKGIYNVDLDNVELYDLLNDRWEQKNLAAAAEHRELVRLFRDYAKQWWERCGQGSRGAEVGTIDAATLKSLEALGYVGGEAATEEEYVEPETPAPIRPPASQPAKAPDRP